MKIRQIITAVTLLLLATGSAFARPDFRQHIQRVGSHSIPHPQNHARGSSNSSKGGASYTAPEIDAVSGTSAIALLTGVLLLAGERARSKRS